MQSQVGQDELEKKRRFFEDQQQMNTRLEKEIDVLDQTISELSVRYNRDELNRVQFRDELGGLKRTVERTSHDLEKARSELGQLKRTIVHKKRLIDEISALNKQLVDDLRRTLESTLSSEENAKRMEDFFMLAKQKELELNMEIKRSSDKLFKVSQELYTLKATEKNLSAELGGCETSLRNLESRIAKLDHDSLKQTEIIYTQDFHFQSMERRLNRLQGAEKSNEEQAEIEKRIGELKRARDDKRAQFDTLAVQFKRVEDETRKSKREIDELSKEKAYVTSRIAELTLHIDTAHRTLDKIVVEKEDMMVNENLKKLELNKLRDTLDKRADEVLALNKERIKLESGMKERFAEINIHQDLLRTQLRSWSDELQTVSSELKERASKVEKLQNRYEIAMISMAPPEGTPPEEASQVLISFFLKF